MERVNDGALQLAASHPLAPASLIATRLASTAAAARAELALIATALDDRRSASTARQTLLTGVTAAIADVESALREVEATLGSELVGRIRGDLSEAIVAVAAVERSFVETAPAGHGPEPFATPVVAIRDYP